MKKEDCKREILSLWESWEERTEPTNYNNISRFHRWLLKERPELLAFNKGKPALDPWQDVHAWINRHEERLNRS